MQIHKIKYERFQQQTDCAGGVEWRRGLQQCLRPATVTNTCNQQNNFNKHERFQQQGSVLGPVRQHSGQQMNFDHHDDKYNIQSYSVWGGTRTTHPLEAASIHSLPGVNYSVRSGTRTTHPLEAALIHSLPGVNYSGRGGTRTTHPLEAALIHSLPGVNYSGRGGTRTTHPLEAALIHSLSHPIATRPRRRIHTSKQDKYKRFRQP